MMYFTVLAIAKGLLKLFYGLEVTGQEHFVKGPALICPNHVSYLDPPIVACSSPEEIHFLARDSLFNKPLFGWFIRKLNSHPVKPSNADTQAFKTVLKCLKAGNKVLIFPEGGRSIDGQMRSLKEGAAMLSIQSGAPIIPLYIDGAFAIWPKNQKSPKSRGKIRASFGPALYPQDYDHYSKKEAKEQLTIDLEKAMLSLNQRG